MLDRCATLGLRIEFLQWNLGLQKNLNSMKDCLQDRRLQWFGLLERMGDNAWPSKCKTFKVSGSFIRGRPRKTWNEVNRKDLKERKVSKDLAKDRNAWKIFHKRVVKMNMIMMTSAIKRWLLKEYHLKHMLVFFMLQKSHIPFLRFLVFLTIRDWRVWKTGTKFCALLN